MACTPKLLEVSSDHVSRTIVLGRGSRLQTLPRTLTTSRKEGLRSDKMTSSSHKSFWNVGGRALRSVITKSH